MSDRTWRHPFSTSRFRFVHTLPKSTTEREVRRSCSEPAGAMERYSRHLESEEPISVTRSSVTTSDGQRARETLVMFDGMVVTIRWR